MTKTVNSLDIQNLLADLEKDVIEAIAAERSDWEYDMYLSHDDELDEETVAKHDERMTKLAQLLELVKWYRNDRIRF